MNQYPIILKDVEEYFEPIIEANPGTSGLASDIAIQLEYRYENNVTFIVNCEEEDYDSEYQKALETWQGRLTAWWYLTQFKYDKFLKLHASTSAEDRTPAESTITTKNNDTPTDSGDYSTDPYTSSVVRTTQSTGLTGFEKYQQATQTLVTDVRNEIFNDFEKNFVIRR